MVPRGGTGVFFSLSAAIRLRLQRRAAESPAQEDAVGSQYNYNPQRRCDGKGQQVQVVAEFIRELIEHCGCGAKNSDPESNPDCHCAQGERQPLQQDHAANLPAGAAGTADPGDKAALLLQGNPHRVADADHGER